jgi:methyl-accepting chemotaxis protein
VHTAKAVIEQSRAAKEIEGAAAEVSKLAAQVATAVAEQTRATSDLAKEGDEVRRVARQTSRAVSEQNQVLSMLSTTTLRHTTGMDRIVTSISEQAAGSQQLGQAVTEIRSRTRELSLAIRSQSKNAHAGDIEALAAEIQQLQSTYLAHVDALAELTTQLGVGAPVAGAVAAESRETSAQGLPAQGLPAQGLPAQNGPAPTPPKAGAAAERA